jgi:predicted CXXCH cytochrome family protein
MGEKRAFPKIHFPGSRRLLRAGTLALGMLLGTALVGSAAENASEKPEEIILRKTCVDAECHTKINKAEVVHGPVAQNQCEVCHMVLSNKHQFALPKPKEELCTVCHKMRQRNFLHEPVEKGECYKCHDWHKSELPFLLAKDPAKDLCFECHEKEKDKVLIGDFLHEPVEKGACILCHDDHSSWNRQLLPRRGLDLCLYCHREEFDKMFLKRHVHKPVLEDCEKCHNPHSGADKALLTMPDVVEQCFDCHKDFGRMIKARTYMHGALETEEKCFNCHDSHATTPPMLIKNNLMDICLGCHNKPIRATDGKLLEDMSQLLETADVKHGPIRQANCVACHSIHASDRFRLLVGEFPEDFYAPFDLQSYNLCFKCHHKDQFLEEKTMALTNFRDGDKNLHFAHVNKKTKGRTCRACHEVHASTRAAHIRMTIPFGGWEIPLKFERDERGGSCASSCHETKTYQREYVTIEPLESEEDRSEEKDKQ